MANNPILKCCLKVWQKFLVANIPTCKQHFFRIFIMHALLTQKFHVFQFGFNQVKFNCLTWFEFQSLLSYEKFDDHRLFKTVRALKVQIPLKCRTFNDQLSLKGNFWFLIQIETEIPKKQLNFTELNKFWNIVNSILMIFSVYFRTCNIRYI